MRKGLGITIGIPNVGGIKSEAVMSLIPNIFLAYNKSGYTMRFNLICPKTTLMTHNRSACAESAILTNSDYLFFVDSDMDFPDDALVKLIELNKDIVGAMYNSRRLPAEPILRLPPGTVIPKVPFRLDILTTGLLLVKTNVFRTLPKPWFAFTFQEGTNAHDGEDVYFCEKAKQGGFDIWCDPTIHVGHIGEFTY